MLGGCVVGPQSKREEEVLYCPDCREAEARWNEGHPDFDVPVKVLGAVQAARRDLPGSAAKSLLRESQLSEPEPVGRFLWIVYRFSSGETVAYNAETRVYLYPYVGEQSPTHADVAALASVLNERNG